MKKVTWTPEPPTSGKTDLVVVAYEPRAKNEAFERLDRSARGAIFERSRAERFRGQHDRVLEWSGSTRRGPRRVAVVGVGPRPGAARWREAVARGVAVATRHRLRSVAVFVDGSGEQIALRVGWSAEALLMASFRFWRYKTKIASAPPPSIGRVGVAVKGISASEGRRCVKLGRARAGAVNLCRELVNEPANELNPEELAARAAGLAEKDGLSCRVLGAREVREQGMSLLDAVARGSEHGPRLAHLVYRPSADPVARIALVGKGVTFDSGGLCIKPGKSMSEMKTDMAGAALVLAAMSALGELGVRAEVHGVVPIAENAVDGRAYRPGDVLTAFSGKTVEIVNTDAEGRLLLADALTYAARSVEPDWIVEHSTLTGSCAVALGNQRAGLISDDEELAGSYLAAAERAGELFWKLPMAPELERDLRSEVADVKHHGGRFGGAISAALFLRRFSGGVPLAHVDMAGPARSDRKTVLGPRGGTGFGVLSVLEHLSAQGEATA
ncbi:MAG: leucyl aminopeptidase [Polyangia bacterium]